MGFEKLPLSASLLHVLQELEFKSLTPIQAQSIPLLLQGRDLIGQSKTGSGKTAAFTLPILQKLDLRDKQIQALVLCPTRELCTQVAREVRKLGRRQLGLQVLILSGGLPLRPQAIALEKGVHWVVGTPGRVLDHLSQGKLDLRNVRTLVLDEADRMLDMGFEKEMKKIMSALPSTRQTVFFSATYPQSIEALSRTYQNNPERITIKESQAEAPEIRQIVYESDPNIKFNGLLWVLQQYKPESAIVFCNLKTRVIELARALSKTNVSSAAIHGDLEQAERDRVMAKFRNKSTRILIATDVAARGIDVENLDAVINFDLPARTDIYVHRIGRTGRAGKKGLAISLAAPREQSKIKSIEKYMNVQISQKTLPPVGNLDVEQIQKTLGQDARMKTLFISGGRKEKMRPGDLLGALTGEAGGLSAENIGKIEIHDHFSYVAVSEEVAQVALYRLRDGRIKGRKFRIEAVR